MLYEFNFDNFHLPKYEYRKLKQISRRKTAKYSSSLDNLIQTDLITFAEWKTNEIGESIPIKNKCEMTTKGLCYLQYCKNHFTDVRLPIIISAFALSVSIIALLFSA